MKTCPECGGGVPFGGGRTVQNAHLMYNLIRKWTPLLKPGPEGDEARRFLADGKRLADSLHAYGHKQSMVNPNWQAAGLWTHQAQQISGT